VARKDEVQNQKRFIQIYEGIEEHLENGCFNDRDFAIYVRLQMMADHKTGVASTNTGHMIDSFGGHNQFGSGDQTKEAVERSVRRSFERLRARGYINYEVTHSRRKHPFLIHKFVARDGRNKGLLLDAFAPGSHQEPVYVREVEELSTSKQAVRDVTVTCPSGDRGVSITCPSGDRDVTVACPQTWSYYKEEEVIGNSQEETTKQPTGVMVCESENYPASQEPEATPDMVCAAAPTHSPENAIPASSTESKMIETPQDGALALSRLILSRCNRPFTNDTLNASAETFLPLVEQAFDSHLGTLAGWNELRDAAVYVLTASKDYPMQGEDGPFTWFDALNNSRDPVATFVKHYYRIAAATTKFLEEDEKKIQKEAERAKYGGNTESGWAAQDACFAEADRKAKAGLL